MSTMCVMQPASPVVVIVGNIVPVNSDTAGVGRTCFKTSPLSGRRCVLPSAVRMHVGIDEPARCTFPPKRRR